MGVERCWTVACRTTTGSGGMSSISVSGSSRLPISSTTIACSARSLSLRSSPSARRRSSSGEVLRPAEPASATVLTRLPRRETSNSGEAPTNVDSPDCHPYTRQSGYRSLSSATRSNAAIGDPRVTRTVRASTTFSTTPASAAATASATASRHSSSGRLGRHRGRRRHGEEQVQRDSERSGGGNHRSRVDTRAGQRRSAGTDRPRGPP